MNRLEKTIEYTEKIKSVLVQMAIDGKLDGDINQLDTTEIEDILTPVFTVLASLETDASMALNGSWDCDTNEGKEGFQAQIDIINAL